MFVVDAPSRSSVSFRPVYVPPGGGGFSCVVYGDSVEFLLVGECLTNLMGFLRGWLLWTVHPAVV